MAQRKLVRRPAARRDIAEAVTYLATEGGSPLSHRFLDELEAAFRRLRSFPQLGRPWPTTNPELAGLRRWPLSHFPYSVFYLATETAIEIVRVLHHSRHIPPLLVDL